MRGYHTDERMGWILESRAAATPDRVAVFTSNGEVTFRQLQARASAIARTLVARGVQNGDAVAWMLPTGAEAIAVASAIWRIGAVSCPIVPISGVHEIAGIMDQIRPVAVITNAMVRGRSLADEIDVAMHDVGHVPKARLLENGQVAGWTCVTAAGPGSLPDSVKPGAPEDPSLVLFTSGTESAPKAAVHSVQGIAHEVRSTIAEWGITFRDRMFMASPMTHITGLLQGFLIPARAGAAAVLMDRWNAEEAVDLIERTGSSYMAGATPFLRELMGAYLTTGQGESSLRQYCCGGAAVPPQLIRDAAGLGIAAYRAWGMTELPTSTLPNELDPLDARAATDGRLAPGVELRVLDDNGDPAAPGETGALYLRGPELFLGYLQPEATERAMHPGGWYETGDVGSIDDAGYVRISGRTRDIINRGGEKFSAREIEELVGRHPDIDAVAVVAIPGGRLGEQIGAVVVSARTAFSVTEIAEFVATLGASRQKRPERLVLVPSIPTNSTGKVDKQALVQLFGQSE